MQKNCSLTDRLHLIMGAVLLLLILPGQSNARNSHSKLDAYARNTRRTSTARPEKFITVHNRGNIQLAVANNGTFGTFGETFQDPFTGDIIPSCTYPRNSDLVYLWVGAFWIGAVVGNDTLVSVGSEDYYQTSEFWPEEPDLGGRFVYNSIDANSKFYNPDASTKALSEQDVYAEYYDTLTDLGLTGQDPIDLRRHIPLGIKVTQRSMSWSYEYADDFILFDFKIENIGPKRLKQAYIGVWVDGDVWHLLNRRPGDGGWDDDVVGFLETFPAPEGCNWKDSVRIAYHMDNDGDPAGAAWDEKSPRSAVGVRVVRTPSDSLNYSFNWWIVGYDDITLDFGPRQIGTPTDPFRRLSDGRLGTPLGDANKYYLLRHKEFDYDSYWSAVDQSLDGWLPPPGKAADFADGYDCRYLLSFGPFDIEPGQELPLSFAWVGGEKVHTSPTAFANLFDPSNPSEFYNTLDFSSLAINSRWASWVYDNPGVDTDSDGYAGKFRYCQLDSNGLPLDSSDGMWYEGDGVPDFRGAGPPPSPITSITPRTGEFIIRWNGFHSETTNDIFLGIPDFEGYRVYAGLDERENSFSLLASYDIVDFNIFRWNTDSSGIQEWLLEGIPLSPDSLRSLFNNPTLDPLIYHSANPLRFNGEFYYFSKQDFNVSDLTDPYGIVKAFPEITTPPDPDPTKWTEDEITHEHGIPLPKYYEYEYVIKNVLPSVPYYLAVTTFDFGSPKVGLPALETQAANDFIIEYAQETSDSVEAGGLEVYTYPNPYRIDGQYRQRGLEGQLLNERDRPDDRNRRIHFANLPKVCKISIYSIDGDLIREIDHDFPNGGPLSSHDTWDLITRNTQIVVSGLYYWVVESSDRTQIGKIVIIH